MSEKTKILLTGFGRDYRYDRISAKSDNVFYGMPPAIFSKSGNKILVDYSPFILADKVIMDVGFYHRLILEPHPIYSDVSKFFAEAFEANRIELVDFEEIISKNRNELDNTLITDLSNLSQWSEALSESYDKWKEITFRGSDKIQIELQEAAYRHNLRAVYHSIECKLQNSLRDKFRHSYFSGREAVFFASAFDKKHLEDLGEARMDEIASLGTYLAYVNVNIALSRELNAPFSDWSDITPFYRKKFGGGVSSIPTNENLDNGLKHLFNMFFPEFAITDPSRFLKLTEDKRVEELRAMCVEASTDAEQFDETFVRKTLLELFRNEKKVSSRLRKVSWLATPLGLTPEIGLVAPKIVDKVAEIVVEKKSRKSLRWIGLMNDIAESQEEN